MSAHSFVPENKRCECGGRIAISERRKERQENLWRCVRCDRVYSKEESPDLRKEWLETVLQLIESRERQIQLCAAAIANEAQLIGQDPSEKNQEILNTLIADYRRIKFRFEHPIASKLDASVNENAPTLQGHCRKTPYCLC